MKSKVSFVDYMRALRLPFVTATIFPFIAGSMLAKNFNILIFFIGLICAVCMHLGANMINDYADSKSGVDWQDKRFYGFFGGSKLIQEGKLDELFYFRHAMIYFAVSALCALLLAVLLWRIELLGYYALIVVLGFFYSCRPIAFAYHYLGEAVLFFLFGPCLVMWAYYLQAGILPERDGLLLAIPFGLFICAILFANEVADHRDDKKCGKHNLVTVIGVKRAYVFYFFLLVMGYIFLIADVFAGYLAPVVWLSLGGLFLVTRAGLILLRSYEDKEKLVVSSKLTIAVFNFTSLIVLFGLYFR